MRLEDILPITESADEPIFVSMLRRLLAGGKIVKSVTDYFGTYRIKSVRYDASTDVYNLDAVFVGDEGDENDTIGMTSAEVERSTLVKRGNAWYIETADAVKESLDDVPLWFTTMRKLIEAEVPVYFAAGGNQITGAKHDDSLPGQPHIILYLKHTRKKYFLQTYTVWPRVYDGLTLVKFKDGYALRFIRDSEPVKEGIEDPQVVSMFKKLIKAGEDVYFQRADGRKVQVRHVLEAEAGSGLQGWWFFDSDSSTRKAATWKIGSNIEKLSLKKDGTHWILYDTTKLREGEEEMPLVVKLMNNRIAKGGAVEVDVEVLPAGRRLKGWVTSALEPSGVLDGLGSKIGTMYKLRTTDHHSGAKGKVLYLTQDADNAYTLVSGKDGNGNKTMRLINRA